MVAGKLNETITIVRSTVSKDAFGATTTNWEDYITTKSSVYQNTGSRTVENNEIVNNYIAEFGIRYYHNINEFDRIRWNSKLYRIESIVPDRHKNHKTIIASLINE